MRTQRDVGSRCPSRLSAWFDARVGRSFDSLVDEAAEVSVEGWDFSWLGGRATEDARQAHRAFLVALAEDAEVGLLSSEYRTWQRRLEQDYANLHAAYDSAMSSGAWDDALRIASALWWFWTTSNRHGVGRAWVEATLRAAGRAVPSSLRARALTVLCYLAGQQLDVDHAVAAGEEALALTTETGDQWGAAWAKQSLALTLMVGGDYDRSATLLDEARAAMDADGEDWRVAGADLVRSVRALVFNQLDIVDAASQEVLRRAGAIGYEPFRCWGHLLRACVAERRGDLTAALAECERALSSARRVELDHYIAFALTQLCRIALLSGAGPTAEAAGRDAIAVAERAGARWFIALARVGLAAVLRQNGNESEASMLLREVLAWCENDAGGGREFFFLALGGDPVELASARLR